MCGAEHITHLQLHILDGQHDHHSLHRCYNKINNRYNKIFPPLSCAAPPPPPLIEMGITTPDCFCSPEQGVQRESRAAI